MNSGDAGELSYANNSDMQRTIAAVTRKARQEMAATLHRARRPASAMAIADLGCATGPNALLMAADAVQAVLADADRLQAPPPEFHVFLNDLPMNDFNSVFRELDQQRRQLLRPDRCRSLVSAWPGSFYGRIFPVGSLDYVVSSSSLHFLSRPPTTGAVNEGRMYVSARGPAAVLEAYRAQFQADFRLFLACRAEEVRHGGVLLLTFVARQAAEPSPHDCHIWDLLAAAVAGMAAEGLVDARKLDSFDVPFYGPCPEELTEAISEEGSFEVRRMELFEVSRRQGEPAADREELAAQTASTVRAVLEPMLGKHFAVDMDCLFGRFSLLLKEYYRQSGMLDQLTNVFLALERK
ncbi:hypothetical protein ABZP36_014477 [Zizania latifolia]